MAAGLNFDDLFKQIPVGDIAARLGVDSGDAAAAVRTALPGLLGGLAANAQSDAGASELQDALSQHRTDGELPPLAAVDVEDGKKIVTHALGANTGAVAAAAPTGGGHDLSNIVSNVLPMLAPMVMSFLANGLGNQKQTGANSGGIADILGQLTGGKSASGGGLTGMLGSILGGK